MIDWHVSFLSLIKCFPIRSSQQSYFSVYQLSKTLLLSSTKLSMSQFVFPLNKVGRWSGFPSQNFKWWVHPQIWSDSSLRLHSFQVIFIPPQSEVCYKVEWKPWSSPNFASRIFIYTLNLLPPQHYPTYGCNLQTLYTHTHKVKWEWKRG